MKKLRSLLPSFISRMFKGAYWEPFQSRSRAKVLAIGFFSNFGYGTLSFVLNYSMAGYGMEGSLPYHTIRLLCLGFVMVPGVFWFLARYPSRIALACFQLCAMMLFLIDPASPYTNSVACAMVFGPFLALHNYGFSKNISMDNKGNETALNSLLIMLSYSAGLFIGGYLLQHDQYYTALFGSSLALIIGTFFLYRPIGGRNNVQKVKSLIGFKKPATRISFFFGMLNPLLDGGMPIWMRALGISPLGAGINMSLRPMIGLLLMPIAGWLIQKKGFKAGQIGGAGLMLGWILLAVAANQPWLIAFALAVITTTSNLIKPMELARWMRRKSSAAVISRELLIDTGRIGGFAGAITLCFTMPVLYPVLGLGLSGLFLFGSTSKRKGLDHKKNVREKNTHLPLG